MIFILPSGMVYSTLLDRVSFESKIAATSSFLCRQLQLVGTVVKSDQVQDQWQPGPVKTHEKQGASSLSLEGPARMRKDWSFS